jgi:hypothetical protein
MGGARSAAPMVGVPCKRTMPKTNSRILYWSPASIRFKDAGRLIEITRPMTEQQAVEWCDLHNATFMNSSTPATSKNLCAGIKKELTSPNIVYHYLTA